MGNKIFFVVVFLLLCIIFIMIRKFIPDSKKNIESTKKFLCQLSVFFLCTYFFPLLFLGLLNFSISTEPEEEKSSTGFTIENYNVELTVKENNTAHVNENIMVNFYEEGYHGIYRYIPRWLKYTSNTGKSLIRKTITSYLKAEEEYYYDSFDDNNYYIRIGDRYKTLPVGDHNYRLSYDYDMGTDPYKGYDEFIFHAYGDFWYTEIKNPSITINMPKNIKEENIKFFKDKKRKKDITKYMDYTLKDNVVVAKYNKEKCELDNDDCSLNNSLTVDILLEEGYFKDANYLYDDSSLKTIGVVFIIFLIVVILWLIFGKEHGKYIKTVEYYPPYNIDPAQAGYLLNETNSKKLTVALMIGLVSKGYIEIHEIDGKQYIVNKCSLSGKINLRTVKKLKLKKLKEADENLSGHYQNMMNNIFKGENEALVGLDYELVVLHLKEEGYISVTEEEVYAHHGILDKEIKYNDISKLKPLTPTEEIVYKNLFSGTEINAIEDDITFYKTFDQVFDELSIDFEEHIFEEKSNKIQTLSFILFFISFGLCINIYFSVKNLNPVYNWLFYGVYVALGIMFYLTITMRKRTLFGEELIEKVKGFKDYLEKVEKDKIETLVEQHPNYFMEIMPYTYIFGLSKKWIKKFEKLTDKMNFEEFDFKNIENFYDSVDSISSINDSFSFPGTGDSFFSDSSSSGSGRSSSSGSGRSSGGGFSGSLRSNSRSSSRGGGGGAW